MIRVPSSSAAVARAAAALAVVVLAAIGAGPDAASAQPSASAVQAPSTDQRANALIGLGRVAAARGNWSEAHARFMQSDRLRPFTPDQVQEHFWIASRASRTDALRIARALADRGHATRAVYVEWIALQRKDPAAGADERLATIARAEQAIPDDAEWTRARAVVALDLEARDQMAASARVWAGIPPPLRDSRPDWAASALRVSAHGRSRAAMAPALDAFVARYPDDDSMRALAVEAWCDAGRPDRALQVLSPLVGPDVATPAHLRRAADLARQAGDRRQARALLERLRATGQATASDTWAFAALLAADREAQALRTLIGRERPSDDACRTRTVETLVASGDITLLADLVPALDSRCSTYGTVATLVAPVLAAREDRAAVRRWLEPLAAAGTLDVHSRLLLARTLDARTEAPLLETLLAPLVHEAADRTDRGAREAAGLLVWARYAEGRAVDAWRLATRLLDVDRMPADERAGLASVALAAGESAAAGRLATTALGSARDVDARGVLAAIGAHEGRAEDVLRWLEPVLPSLRTPGHLLLWLDARAALAGPADALQHAASVAPLVDADVELTARRATWAAATGDSVAAADDLERVRTRDAERAARLDVELALAEGAADRAWLLASTVSPARYALATPAWDRLALDAALMAGRWSEAARVLGGMADLPADDRLLAMARLRIGRDAALDDETRHALAALVHANRRAADARVLRASDAVASGSPAAALAMLSVGADDPAIVTAPPEMRRVAAAAWLALGRPDQVLRIVSTADRQVGLRLLRGRALFASGKAADAREVLERLAHDTGRADAYLAWAEAAALPTDRLRVLRLGRSAAPDAPELRVALADALLQAGDFPAARAEIDAASGAGQAGREIWRVRVRLEGLSNPVGLPAILRAGRAALGSDAESTLLLAEAAASAPGLAGEAVTTLMDWMGGLPDTHRARALEVQAHVGIGTGRWDLAGDAVAQLVRLQPGDARIRRLEAQVTAWSGLQAEAVPLYEAYLAADPDDVEAWREYARLLSWREAYDEAVRAYAHVRALAGIPAVDAEARTRLAVLRRDWPSAAEAAAAWRELEPDALDPVVDLAHALEQRGDAIAATRVYADIARRPHLPDSVRRTLDARAARHAPRATFAVGTDSAEGYGGQLLLERRQAMLSGEADLAVTGVRLFGQAGQGSLETGNTRIGAFVTGLGGLRAAFGAGRTVEASLGTMSLDGREAVLASARVSAPLGRRLVVDGQVGRRPFWENGQTVIDRLQATSAGLRVRSAGLGRLALQAGVDWSNLDDGNGRRQVDAAISREFGSGAQVVELRAGGFLFGYDEARPRYFSPGTFGRIDIDAGLTRWFGDGAGVRDGRFAWSGRLGTGLDTRGEPYLLAGTGGSLPVWGGLALTGDVRLTSARVYRAWAASVGMAVDTRRGAWRGARAR